MAVKRIVSGIQPSGHLHIGNYLGAIKNFIELQNNKEYECFFFVADLHSLSETYDPKEKNMDIYRTVAALLSLGVDPKKATLFIQSRIDGHTELSWLFSTITPVSELERMTQYKDKAARQKNNINAALLTYPILQAADVLLYRGELVPVGKDQEQHVELMRVIAKRMNSAFGCHFPEPKPLYTNAPKILSLRDPKKKMSKSLGSAHVLNIFDDEKTTEKKIKKAVSSQKVDAKDEGSENLRTLYKEFVSPTIPKTFAELKSGLASGMNSFFAEARAQYNTYMDNTTELDIILEESKQKAQDIATETLSLVQQDMGLL